MNKVLVLMVIGISGLCIGCDPEEGKIREEIEHIADIGEQEESSE